LDEVLGDLPSFHVAKIDVEGHELQALRGMRKLLARSPRAVVLFEKLIPNAGLEAPVLELFSACGMRLWRIDGVRLLPVDLGAFEASSAYFLAARPETIGDELDRGFLRIQPGHLLKSQAHPDRMQRELISSTAPTGICPAGSIASRFKAPSGHPCRSR
jgi:hypothetical protein